MNGLFDDMEAAELRPRTWWRFAGEEVEVMGTSPLMVWFHRAGESQLAQRTLTKEGFCARAVFLRESAQ